MNNRSDFLHKKAEKVNITPVATKVKQYDIHNEEDIKKLVRAERAERQKNRKERTKTDDNEKSKTSNVATRKRKREESTQEIEFTYSDDMENEYCKALGKSKEEVFEYIEADISEIPLLKGKGLVAKKFLPKGTRIFGLYDGVRVPGKKTNSSSQYLFETIDDENIDAQDKRNSTAYINHGQTANVKVKTMDVGGKRYIGFILDCDVNAGEQLLYDYGINFENGLPFSMFFLNRTHSIESDTEIYHDNKTCYEETGYNFADQFVKTLGLKKKDWLIPRIFSAVASNDVEKLKELLQQGHQVDLKAYTYHDDKLLPSQDQEHLTPLMLAAYLGNDCIDVLLEAGADPDFQMLTKGYTPLMLLLNGPATAEIKNKCAVKLINKMKFPEVHGIHSKSALCYSKDLDLYALYLLANKLDSERKFINEEVLAVDDLIAKFFDNKMFENENLVDLKYKTSILTMFVSKLDKGKYSNAKKTSQYKKMLGNLEKILIYKLQEELKNTKAELAMAKELNSKKEEALLQERDKNFALTNENFHRERENKELKGQLQVQAEELKKINHEKQKKEAEVLEVYAAMTDLKWQLNIYKFKEAIANGDSKFAEGEGCKDASVKIKFEEAFNYYCTALEIINSNEKIKKDHFKEFIHTEKCIIRCYEKFAKVNNDQTVKKDNFIAVVKKSQELISKLSADWRTDLLDCKYNIFFSQKLLTRLQCQIDKKEILQSAQDVIKAFEVLLETEKNDTYVNYRNMADEYIKQQKSFGTPFNLYVDMRPSRVALSSLDAKRLKQ